VTRPLIKRVEIPVEGYNEARAERAAVAAPTPDAARRAR
jgi:hypothetical protein